MKNLLLFFSAVMILIPAEEIFSIPAFARKYNMTCKVCHSPFPTLKEYGDEFAGNGFVLKDQDAPRYFVDAGDEELSLIRDIPIAVRLEGYLTYNYNNNEKVDFSSPYLLKLLSGGTIDRDVAYYFYFFLSERGDVAGIEDAFIMFNDLFGSELDVYVGQFQVSDPLFKRELRLTLDDYMIYKKRVGASELDLTYDRGVMLTYGFDTGTDIVLEILNGNGIGSAGSLKEFDKDKYKNILGRISQDAGDHFRIGAAGYWGKEESNNNVNEMWLAGPDFSITIDPVELNVQYLERRDKNPFFMRVPPDEIKTRGAFGELIFRPQGDDSKLYYVALFNWVESDLNYLNSKTASFHIGYLLNRNVRLVTEYSHDFTLKYGNVGIGFITAF